MVIVSVRHLERVKVTCSVMWDGVPYMVVAVCLTLRLPQCVMLRWTR
jgi:hypothetical protein